MGKIQKKYEKGAAATYISRTQALKKLQLSLKDFRRLCILKGVYPHEPRHKKKVNKGGLQNKTWYYVKDINFLAHEPIINKFREYKIYLRKLKKAVSKNEGDTARRLRDHRPKYNVDHIVRERYPTFTDAVRDLDDALCMVFLFARMPHSKTVQSTLTQLCRRLSNEFLLYIIESRSLRKVFVSIKGIYYQADIMGNTVTWIVPHDRCLQQVTDVDFQIMATFVEFYITMLGFINFKLYSHRGMIYPPQLEIEKFESDYMDDEDAATERIYALSQALQKNVDAAPVDEFVPDEFPEENVDDDQMAKKRKEQDQLKRLRNLFEGSKIFLSREVPRQSLAFIIRCYGGQVSWDKMDGYGATFLESDETVTHQIVDRPNVDCQHLSRYYVQPQWIYDSINARLLLPVEDYYPGAVLPPHLSPFVEETGDDYVPPEKLKLLQLQGEDITMMALPDEEEKTETSAADDAKSSKKRRKVDGESKAIATDEKPALEKIDQPKKRPMQVKEGKVDRTNVHKRVADQVEERKLQEMLIAKKHKRAYQKIKFGEKRKAKEVRKLKEKRKLHDKSGKSV